MHTSLSLDENFTRIKELLSEMFRLDRGDLDFGLYRIMNMKRDEVESFVNEELLPQVEFALGEAQDASVQAAQKKYDEKLKQARDLDFENPEQVPAVQEAHSELVRLKSETAQPTNVYNHLYLFFSRYYDAGDFMSLRRHRMHGKEAYSIPYGGEEVKQYWANSDQYYIKSTANYQSYLFTVGEGDGQRQVRFQIVNADNEKDSIKESNDKQRRFVLAGKDAVHEEEGVLVIDFEHRPLTESEKETYGSKSTQQKGELNRTAKEKILSAAKKIDTTWQNLLTVKHSTDINADHALLDKHLATYVEKNEFDYFIHKDLSGFLSRELDFYLKSNVLDMDDIEREETVLTSTLITARAIRRVGQKIIAFLAQLEEFQKMLWLKKKFVLETDYCITLDRIPDDFYPKIAANKKQIKEWQALFAIEEIKGGKKPSAKFLQDNPFLVLDTAHFNADFKNRLLTALSDRAAKVGMALEETMDGLLIHGENFQALNLLQARYRKQVQLIYIDPPYNTPASEILYKNGYKHSSWLSLMHDRIQAGKMLLDISGCQVTAINDVEHVKLSHLLSDVFLGFEKDTVVIQHHPACAGLADTNIYETHEYAIFMTPLGQKTLHGKPKSQEYSEVGFMRTGTANSNLRVGRPNSFYAVLVSASGDVVGAESPPETDSYPLEDTEEGLVRIYPVSSDGTERVWRRSYKKFFGAMNEGEVVLKGSSLCLRTSNNGKYRPIFSNWTDSKYTAGVHGTGLLKDILGGAYFNYPKSIHTVFDCVASATRTRKSSIVLDYFSGSGTTGHAVINLNREDGGKRKYVLIEMGHHFNSVLLPRMKKVVYSPDWKEGKPNGGSGSTQFFKYLRLESYEDTLDSLIRKPLGSDLLANLEEENLRENYHLRYALEHETRGSATLLGDNFENPDNYTLSIVRDGSRQDEKADLPETFNYLLGITVIGRWYLDDVLAIVGTDPKHKRYLILWRNMSVMSNTKLEKWFKKHRSRFGDDINIVYVNGDQTLNTQKTVADSWEARSIEPTFRQLMFDKR